MIYETYFKSTEVIYKNTNIKVCKYIQIFVQTRISKEKQSTRKNTLGILNKFYFICALITVYM